jgi:hypothetical protein
MVNSHRLDFLLQYVLGVLIKGKSVMKKSGFDGVLTSIVPPLFVSTFVQIVNMPLIRSTITIQVCKIFISACKLVTIWSMQNPSSELATVMASMRHISSTKGISALWHGTSAGSFTRTLSIIIICTDVGIMKTVPKYITAVVVKDILEDHLPRGDSSNRTHSIIRSAVKSVVAGVAGAALTNPFDVLRNE